MRDRGEEEHVDVRFGQGRSRQRLSRSYRLGNWQQGRQELHDLTTNDRLLYVSEWVWFGVDSGRNKIEAEVRDFGTLDALRQQ